MLVQTYEGKTITEWALGAKQLEAALAEKEQLLEQQRTATYQAVMREQAMKKLLSEKEREHLRVYTETRNTLTQGIQERDVLIQQKEREIEGLTKKVENLTAWYDKMFGTPCEEIRHQQQVDQLQADLDQVVGKVVQFASAIAQDMIWQADRNDAKEVLASPLVQSWQARQQEGKG